MGTYCMYWRQNGANANVENRNIHFIIVTDEYRRDKGLDKTKFFRHEKGYQPNHHAGENRPHNGDCFRWHVCCQQIFEYWHTGTEQNVSQHYQNMSFHSLMLPNVHVYSVFDVDLLLFGKKSVFSGIAHCKQTSKLVAFGSPYDFLYFLGFVAHRNMEHSS